MMGSGGWVDRWLDDKDGWMDGRKEGCAKLLGRDWCLWSVTVIPFVDLAFLGSTGQGFN